jgi:hypothetical protein
MATNNENNVVIILFFYNFFFFFEFSILKQRKIYQTVIDEVIQNVRDQFLDEGFDDQLLQELKSVIRIIKFYFILNVIYLN